eukprot:CAMPEP_0179000598 /NCGR_PEP_ID=MMETSP0795-20121207/10782_1 /TAXON_ID=88552 /ORGANISM="Amoebophrya sp., Strain Ameob2" /LENGTH=663 /DNA_ID=CAMNT_0020693655 /DNA_START=388 /DNA_END=2379 /DNA_ORIENTATION=+
MTRRLDIDDKLQGNPRKRAASLSQPKKKSFDANAANVTSAAAFPARKRRVPSSAADESNWSSPRGASRSPADGIRSRRSDGDTKMETNRDRAATGTACLHEDKSRVHDSGQTSSSSLIRSDLSPYVPTKGKRLAPRASSDTAAAEFAAQGPTRVGCIPLPELRPRGKKRTSTGSIPINESPASSSAGAFDVSGRVAKQSASEDDENAFPARASCRPVLRSAFKSEARSSAAYENIRSNSVDCATEDEEESGESGPLQLPHDINVDAILEGGSSSACSSDCETPPGAACRSTSPSNIVDLEAEIAADRKRDASGEHDETGTGTIMPRTKVMAWIREILASPKLQFNRKTRISKDALTLLHQLVENHIVSVVDQAERIKADIASGSGIPRFLITGDPTYRHTPVIKPVYHHHEKLKAKIARAYHCTYTTQGGFQDADIEMLLQLEPGLSRKQLQAESDYARRIIEDMALEGEAADARFRQLHGYPQPMKRAQKSSKRTVETSAGGRELHRVFSDANEADDDSTAKHLLGPTATLGIKKSSPSAADIRSEPQKLKPVAKRKTAKTSTKPATSSSRDNRVGLAVGLSPSAAHTNKPNRRAAPAMKKMSRKMVVMKSGKMKKMAVRKKAGASMKTRKQPSRSGADTRKKAVSSTRSMKKSPSASASLR